jgi:alkylation response protein AidB-like acyl-CoA dehydrogenase
MDFTFTEEQRAVAESAAAVFGAMAGAERLAQVEATDERVDEQLWAALARTQLLGLVVPEAQGGAGLGLTEACLVLEQQGRHVAPVPLWATTVLGALPIARFGSPSQRRELLPAVADGSLRMSAALTEMAANPRQRPSAVATREAGGGWRLSGRLQAVPQAHVAGRVLVPAHCPSLAGGVMVALVDPASPGVTLERAVTTDRQVHPHMNLQGVRIDPDDVIAPPEGGVAVVAFMVEAAVTGLCALQLGITEEALARAAEYTNQREQFGRPLSAFQGAMLRAADAYIDTEAIRVTTWQAAWRLDTGRPAAQAVAVAKWWASEAGQRVVHTTQHLHGGLGADVSYPIHRYFLWGKQIELMLEGPAAQLARLGDLVADEVLQALAEEASTPPTALARRTREDQ